MMIQTALVAHPLHNTVKYQERPACEFGRNPKAEEEDTKSLFLTLLSSAILYNFTY